MDKFDHVIYLFTMIKKKPGLYIGSESLVRLKSFIDGYIFALKIKENDYQTEQYKKFNKWLKKYNIHTVESWDSYLIRIVKDEEKSFDLFFEQLELFLKKDQTETV